MFDEILYRPDPSHERMVEPEPLDLYLEDIRDTPVLDRSGQAELGAKMARAEADLRSALAHVPEVARRLLAHWYGRRAKGLSTGALSRFHRDPKARDVAARVDQDLEAIEVRVARFEKAAVSRRPAAREALAACVDEAEIALPLLISFLEPVAVEADPAECGGPAEFERLVGEARESLAQLTDARNRFIAYNLRLVVRAAKSYRGRGIPFSDLVQEGNIGLIRAVEKFDYTRGYTFSTYAMWWIEQALRRAVLNDERVVRVPTPILDKQRAMRQVESEMRLRSNAEPTDLELAEALGEDASECDALRMSLSAELSLDAPLVGADDLTVGDALAADGVVDPVDEIDSQVKREAVAQAIEGLTPRSRLVIEKRFGLKDGVERSLSVVGDEVGLSRERVRQIEKQAIESLRSSRRTRSLLDERESA